MELWTITSYLGCGSYWLPNFALLSFRPRRGVAVHVANTCKQHVSSGSRDRIKSSMRHPGLQVDDDAPANSIKTAYRNLARECHPDYLGEEGHNICILLNEVSYLCHTFIFE